MDSWKRKLRMGMVGGGEGAFIGPVHRIAASLDLQIELVAGCFSRDVDNTSRTGRQLYLEPSRCYRTYQEMASMEASLPADRRIDFVAIVVPPVSHFPIAKAFLEAGIHVVCDKPMTFSLEEAVRLAELVEQTGLVFGLTHNYTGYPLVRHANWLCRSGKIGRVRKVLVEYLQDCLMMPIENENRKEGIWRLDPAQVGASSTITEAGSHCLNLMEFVTGDPVIEICADRTIFLPGRVLEEDANVMVRLKGGGTGVVTLSQIATGEENNLNFRIYGSEGALIWNQEQPNSLLLYRYGQPRQILSRGHPEYLSEPANQVTRIPSGHPEGYLEAFATLYNGIAKAIRRHIDGDPMKPSEYEFPSVWDGLRTMQFVDSAVKSCDRESAWTPV